MWYLQNDSSPEIDLSFCCLLHYCEPSTQFVWSSSMNATLLHRLLRIILLRKSRLFLWMFWQRTAKNRERSTRNLKWLRPSESATQVCLTSMGWVCTDSCNHHPRRLKSTLLLTIQTILRTRLRSISLFFAYFWVGFISIGVWLPLFQIHSFIKKYHNSKNTFELLCNDRKYLKAQNLYW